MVGGGGGSSGAAGSGQFTGLPTPGTFSGFDLIFCILSPSAPSHFYFYIYVLLVVPSLAQGSFTSTNSSFSLVMRSSGPGHPFYPSFGSLFPPSPRWSPVPFAFFSCACSLFIKRPRPLIHVRFSRSSGPEGDPGAAVWAVTL